MMWCGRLTVRTPRFMGLCATPIFLPSRLLQKNTTIFPNSHNCRGVPHRSPAAHLLQCGSASPRVAPGAGVPCRARPHLPSLARGCLAVQGHTCLLWRGGASPCKATLAWLMLLPLMRVLLAEAPPYRSLGGRIAAQRGLRSLVPTAILLLHRGLARDLAVQCSVCPFARFCWKVHVARVYFKCFRYFRGMLQVLYIDIAKVYRDVALLQWLYTCVSSVCSKCFICKFFIWMLHIHACCKYMF
jgi:hypothetical protein